MRWKRAGTSRAAKARWEGTGRSGPESQQNFLRGSEIGNAEGAAWDPCPLLPHRIGQGRPAWRSKALGLGTNWRRSSWSDSGYPVHCAREALPVRRMDEETGSGGAGSSRRTASPMIFRRRHPERAPSGACSRGRRIPQGFGHAPELRGEDVCGEQEQPGTARSPTPPAAQLGNSGLLYHWAALGLGPPTACSTALHW